MRRILAAGLFVLLFAAACVSPRVVTRIPIIGTVTLEGPPPARPPEPPQPVQCEEISRIPCDFVHCQAFGYDFVTKQCSGKSGVTTSCVQNSSCKAE
jgi:hypothetical protein